MTTQNSAPRIRRYRVQPKESFPQTPEPESWGQPPIGLYAPVIAGNRTTWHRLLGVNYCSSTYVPTSLAQEMRLENLAWDAASDEALGIFERSLGT